MFLKNLWGTTKDFPYEIKEPVVTYDGKSLWKLHNGNKKIDRSPVSIFAFDPKKNANQLAIFNNCFKRSKIIRHPNVLTFIDGLEIDASSNVGYIVTEEMIPLEEALNDAKTYPGSISWGLYSIIKALSFINNNNNLVHGNITMSSVFVNKAGDWKLGGLDLVGPPNDATAAFRVHKDLVGSQYKSPEYNKANWSAIEEGPVYALDIWSLACLIYEIYNGKLTKTEDLKKVGNIPKEMLPMYQSMLSSNPSARPNPQKLLESNYFNNNYVETCQFLENITLKEAYEKEKFFKKLNSSSDEFPAAVCKYKILPHLVNALDFGSANSTVLGPLLKIGKHLSAEEYAAQVTPSVIKWFATNDRALRMNLLQNLDQFIDHLTPAMVSDQIFPHVATGFTDMASPVLREQTVKSMLLLVPKLTEKVITTQMLKYLAKLQMDEEAGIRTNTTICIAKIAQYLTSATRKKVLSPAFGRALKDPFPRARISGLMSFNATEAYYSKDDIAINIVPGVSALTIDPDKEVREAAFKTMDLFIRKLKKISDTGIEENIDDVKPEASSVLGWALGSIKKMYGDNATGTPNMDQKSSAIGSSLSGSNSGSSSDLQSMKSPTSATKNNISAPKPKKEKVEDSDDDKEGWNDDINFDDVQKPSTSNNSNSFNNKPTTSTSNSSSKKEGWDDDEDDDFDDFAKPTIVSKPLKPLPSSKTKMPLPSNRNKSTPQTLTQTQTQPTSFSTPKKVESEGWDDDGGDDGEGWDDFDIGSATKIEPKVKKTPTKNT